MNEREIIEWLLEGDVAIQYQTWRDLLHQDRTDLRDRIATEGWGYRFLKERKPEGHWGKRFYEPKWISSHYTLLDLKQLNISPDHPDIKRSVQIILEREKGPDGGVGPFGDVHASDVCVNGMFLNYASYFRAPEQELRSIVDFILSQKMIDGGFNCRSNRSGAVHSSLHTTLSVLEGFVEYEKNGYHYRLDEAREACRSCMDFILLHRFFLSDRTGEIIKKDFLRLTYPGRWRYDILRALDCFRDAGAGWDDRMKEAVAVLVSKRNKTGTWNLQAGHPGKVHFEMEKAGKPGRWNTLRALRVLHRFAPEMLLQGSST